MPAFIETQFPIARLSAESYKERKATNSQTLTGLRRWTNGDVVPRPGDVFRERLYCIRWVKTVTGPDGKTREIRRYAALDEADH